MNPNGVTLSDERSSKMASRPLGYGVDKKLDPKIASIDLSKVKMKLMEPEPEGKGWSDEVATRAEKWYRRFLHVILHHPEARPVPNHEIDVFLHQHILDTRAYAQDCQDVFGRFIHHYPYFGLNGDAEERDECYVDTNSIYMMEFGEDCMTPGLRAEGCTAPCVAEACTGGGTCSACTVDGGGEE